jgi:hypothetical protein
MRISLRFKRLELRELRDDEIEVTYGTGDNPFRLSQAGLGLIDALLETPSSTSDAVHPHSSELTCRSPQTYSLINTDNLICDVFTTEDTLVY